jgi:hypothetical protein
VLLTVLAAVLVLTTRVTPGRLGVLAVHLSVFVVGNAVLLRWTGGMSAPARVLIAALSGFVYAFTGNLLLAFYDRLS